MLKTILVSAIFLTGVFANASAESFVIKCDVGRPGDESDNENYSVLFDLELVKQPSAYTVIEDTLWAREIHPDRRIYDIGQRGFRSANGKITFVEKITDKYTNTYKWKIDEANTVDVDALGLSTPGVQIPAIVKLANSSYEIRCSKYKLATYIDIQNEDKGKIVR